jgi:aminocarboxymuconate-semialdehyde decarboxylase
VPRDHAAPRTGPVTLEGRDRVSVPVLKIDVHTHILPESWPDLRERYGYGGFVRLEHHAAGCARMIVDGRTFREIGDNTWNPERRLADCDRHGVRVQVLSTVPVMFCYWAKPRDAHDLARRLNDHIASVVQAHPRRFVGLGTLPMQDSSLAVRELERCVGELGLAGVEIGTNVGGRNLDDPGIFPVLERAEELGACVFVHPWEMLARERMPKYWLPWLVGMPAETSLAICCLIFAGVLERLPDLRICFAHGGGAFPATLGRIAHGFAVRPDLVAVDNPRDPREYVDRLYLDSMVHDAPALRHLLEVAGPDRIALGSDYPFPLGEPVPGKLIESLDGLEPWARARMLAGTALEFLGRRREDFLPD